MRKKYLTKKQIEKRMDSVYDKIVEQQKAEHAGLGKFGRGLQSEGFVGGYLAALRDVDLLIRGMRPRRNGWWEEADNA